MDVLICNQIQEVSTNLSINFNSTMLSIARANLVKIALIIATHLFWRPPSACAFIISGRNVAYQHLPLCNAVARTRYLMRYASKNDDDDISTKGEDEMQMKNALFGMGCFWAPQQDFLKVPGVVSVATGYTPLDPARGNKNDESSASYFSVSSGDGRVESVLVEYDSSVVSYKELLQTFWQFHDASIGSSKPQYQSTIWALSKIQAQIAQDDKERAADAYSRNGLDRPKTVIIDTADDSGNIVESSQKWLDQNFVKAESIHQNFWPKIQIKILSIILLTYVSGSIDELPTLFDTGSRILGLAIFAWAITEAVELVLSAVGIQIPSRQAT